MKKILNKIADFCSDYFCLFIVIIQIVLLIVISIGIFNNTEDNNDCNNDSVVLASFNNGDISDLIPEKRSTIYFEFGTITFNHSGSRLVSVAPLSLYYESGDGLYLGYPVPDDSDTYHYNFTSVSSLYGNSLTLPIAFYIPEYSSDIWSISTRIDFNINNLVLANEFMTNVTGISKSLFAQVVPSPPLSPVAYGYGITNEFLFHYMNTSTLNYGTISVYQIEDQSSSSFTYDYNYNYVPLMKIVGVNYDYAYNLGSQNGYDKGYYNGSQDGYNKGYGEGSLGATPFTAIVNGLNNLMNISLFGGVSIGDLLLLMLGVVLFGGLLKVFRF